ncbi:hypothetical protein CC86DRAFT_410047 [Ophiobolus disseminans]|uniref:Uncharacterized protein n=1 Tax=Ophiobolus disseminans TaxID=1469910 RepID=A0A6A6ZPC7_9PLEO|nr:hypothetical protein CC86DRAFT_410047 [Ophiobolus disseminans]
MLDDCTSLTELRTTIHEHFLFHEDQEGLEDFFLRGQELKSKGLDSFQKMLKSLPNLRNADIDTTLDTKRRLKVSVTAKSMLQSTNLHLAYGRVVVKFQDWEAISDADKRRFDTTHPNPAAGAWKDWMLAECELKPGEYEKWLDNKPSSEMAVDAVEDDQE